MKKIMLLVLVSLTTLLSGCGLRERLLAPPDEMEVPAGSLEAVCTVGEDVYTHVYKGDGIYLYYINGVLQGDEELDNTTYSRHTFDFLCNRKRAGNNGLLA